MKGVVKRVCCEVALLFIALLYGFVSHIVFVKDQTECVYINLLGFLSVGVML